MPNKYRPKNMSALDVILHYAEKTAGCWGWKAATNKAGYGIVNFKGKMTLAHRLSWESHFGFIHDDLFVCHKCDNPPCVNPDHLFLGTHRDNMKDRDHKGRGYDRNGVKNGRAKLNPSDIKGIKLRYFAGDLRSSIADYYGITETHLYRIVKGTMWKSLESED